MTYRQAGCGPCGGCGSSVQAECGDRCLDINYDPANNCVVYFTKDGCSAPFDGTKMVQCAETDTRLELDRDGCDIRFYSERYYTAGTAPQAINIHDLGGCIALGDLANVAETANHPDHCSFLVYKKAADCGDGCEGKDDAWQPWSPLKNKADGLHYVMGLNDEGCPIALNDPTGSFGNNSNDKYWWAMWRPDGQFGYIQPEKVASLPKDDAGNVVAIGQNANGKPVVGPLDIEGYLNEKECTFFDPAPGYKIDGGNEICYYKNQNMLSVVLDLAVTAPTGGGNYFNLHIATIHDSRFWPQVDGYIDLPVHGCWKVNGSSDGSITPIWLRFDNQGRLLLSGEVTARTATGKTAWIVSGVDDMIKWPWKG